MSGRSLLPMLAGLIAMDPKLAAPKIASYKIEAKLEVQQLSKRRIQKLKGKGARKNRGNNR